MSTSTHARPAVGVLRFSASESGAWSNSYLLSDDQDALLFDVFQLRSDAKKLADAIDASGKRLTKVWISHAQALQRFRADAAMSAYVKSSLLKYLEEAMAETYAQLKVNGINMTSLVDGVKFPVTNGYVKMWKLGPVADTPALPLAAEAGIGTSVVGGCAYGVYLVATADTSGTSPAPTSTAP